MYIKAELEIIEFAVEDVIVTSGATVKNKTTLFAEHTLGTEEDYE